MIKYFSVLYFVLLSFWVFAQMPKPAFGTIERHDNFTSKFVTARNVDVWLPEGYSPKKKYSVLYMHDGQMLFDSSVTWNKQEWQVDEMMSRLIREGKIKDCIVVGVWNGGKTRHPDYFPQKPFETLTQVAKDSIYKAARANGHAVFGEYKIQSDAYLKFLVKELKPFIDRKYATRKDRKHTFIAGSSMGGLISMYAICEYPKVFGGAACLSTHWPGIFKMEGNPIPDAFLHYLKTHLPNPNNHKLYFDHGTLNLDSSYAPYQQKADVILKSGKYSDKNLLSLVFPGEDHAERSWSKRLHIPLTFLMQ